MMTDLMLEQHKAIMCLADTAGELQHHALNLAYRCVHGDVYEGQLNTIRCNVAELLKRVVDAGARIQDSDFLESEREKGAEQ